MGHGDFLGAFAVHWRGERCLMVGNDRQIGGRTIRTWDLPGGRVEPGELLAETVARELREETGLTLRGAPEFLFVQEGQRRSGLDRQYAWRSFFFAVDVEPGEPAPGHEVLAVRWMDRRELLAECTAPYHDSFLQWLLAPAPWWRSVWQDG